MTGKCTDGAWIYIAVSDRESLKFTVAKEWGPCVVKVHTLLLVISWHNVLGHPHGWNAGKSVR